MPGINMFFFLLIVLFRWYSTPLKGEKIKIYKRKQYVLSTHLIIQSINTMPKQESRIRYPYCNSSPKSFVSVPENQYNFLFSFLTWTNYVYHNLIHLTRFNLTVFKFWIKLLKCHNHIYRHANFSFNKILYSYFYSSFTLEIIQTLMLWVLHWITTWGILSL